MGKHTPMSSKERVAKHRAAMKAKGLRLKQMWVPDMTDPVFLEQLRKAGEAIANSPTEAEDQAWVESIMEGVWDSEPDYKW